MPPVQQSAPKWELLLALDLELSDARHKELYSHMKSEAVSVYDECLKGHRDALKQEFQNAPEPWSQNQFKDSALRAAIEKIIRRASPQTHPLYARGPMNGNNWVAKWMLYHVCRYRDHRNSRCRSTRFHDDDCVFPPQSGSQTSSSVSSSSSPRAPSSMSSGSRPTSSGGPRPPYYDAARNSYRIPKYA